MFTPAALLITLRTGQSKSQCSGQAQSGQNGRASASIPNLVLGVITIVIGDPTILVGDPDVFLSHVR